jgi:putative endonuclease
LASARNGTIYVGVTSDIVRRVHEHKSGMVAGFSKKYDVNVLVYYELHDDMISAMTREKRVKKWKRDWKLKLIEEFNPDWRDLYDDIVS